MAGYPPPYPPPGSPYGFDPKQQARLARQQIKAQVRAQQAAFRAQRDLYRYQTRAALLGNRRSSILGPLIVVAIGVVILLIRMGRIPFYGFWTWYAHWWPLLLVAAGVVLVAEWAFDQIPREDGAPYVRRGFGGGAAFLLILLAIAGAVDQGLWNHRADDRNFVLRSLTFDTDDLDEFFGNKHEMTQPIEAECPVGTSLTIDNPHGDVTIVGKSDDNKVHITVNKEVWTESDNDADAKAQRLSPQISRMGSALSIIVPSIPGAISGLSITVPDFAETTVNANHGDVNISAIKAPVTVTANHGDIELNSIAGPVSAHINNHGSSFTAHQIAGDLSIHGHADDMSVTDVSGRVSFDGEFYGDTHMERLRGPMSFHTNRTQFSVQRLDGEIDISPNSALSGNQIVGPTTLHTRSRNIEFDRIAGNLDVVNSDGSVEVTGAPPLGDVSIQDKNGQVDLNVPEHTGFSVDAETNGGEIESDLDLSTSNRNNRVTLQGTVAGGGPRITVRTTHLDIGIHRKPVAPLAPLPPLAPPSPPSAPKPPAAPQKPVV